jgi:hypothetical protein
VPTKLSSISPLPSIVASVDESIKNGLEASRELWFVLLVISTVLVFIGVVLEEAEGWMPYLERLLPVTEITQYRLIKRIAKIGWILIVVGVMGEGAFEVLVSRADSRLQQFNEATLNEARREAGDAAASAQTARNEADAAVKSAFDARTIANGARLESHTAAKLAGKVGDKAEKVGEKAREISTRLDTASQQLAQVEERVRVQGPRSKLLINGQNAFVQALKQFKGQKVILVTCAPRQSPLQTDEEYDFELTLLNRLVEPRPGSVPGAGWTVLSEGHDSWYPCKASGWGRGVWVMYSAPSAKAAAEALGRALNELKINADTTWIIPKDASEYARQKRQPNDFNALWEKVAREPTGIYILTGENPHTFDPRN